MKMKVLVAAAATLASSSAFAGATGNAGVVSDYLFRGVEQSLGGGSAQVYGGLDYAHESGLYIGTWVSSLDSSTYETDGYVGFSGKAGDLGYDVGYIFYGYRDAPVLNYSEVYGGLSFSGLSAKFFYSPEFGATQDSAYYITGSYALAISETLALTPQVGYSAGDGIETAFGGAFKDYFDYSLTLAKTVEGGYTFSFAVIGNSEDDTLGKETVVVGLKKAFDL
ncbi:TorF family putative porin [Hydrocarboniphaga sp.]|uniref:TorF family putative porin n=1 Tax=Hydrocarboniphaga sp. TaxID=2033016 RepID=UPI003D12BA8C